MMDNQFYPDWQSFAFKYRGREQDAFEDLARTLFRKEMGIKFAEQHHSMSCTVTTLDHADFEVSDDCDILELIKEEK